MSRQVIISLVIIEIALIGAVAAGLGMAHAATLAVQLLCASVMVLFVMVILAGVRQISREDDARTKP